MWDETILSLGSVLFIRNSASLLSDLQILTLGWNCPISHSMPWLIIVLVDWLNIYQCVVFSSYLQTFMTTGSVGKETRNHLNTSLVNSLTSYRNKIKQSLLCLSYKITVIHTFWNVLCLKLNKYYTRVLIEILSRYML